MTDKKHPDYDAYQIMAEESNEKMNVKTGDLGGYISKKENLDTTSSAWIFDECVVLGDSVITGNAVIENGSILNNVTVGFDSRISNVKLNDMMMSEESVKIYSNEPNTVVVADPRLSKKAITAKIYNGNSPIFIGYGTFFGDIDLFENYAHYGKFESDSKLCEEYTKLIKDILKPDVLSN